MADFTFYELLTELNKDGRTLRIPEYQRDYAQGRLNKKVKPIRITLVNDLVNSLIDKDNNKTVDLDFIYGATEDGAFVLVDGQQRMTMLFLLHWYVFLRSGLLDNKGEEYNIMKKFSYASRTTSKAFCERLLKVVNDDIKFDKVKLSKSQENKSDEDEVDYCNEKSLSGHIKNFSWFKGSMESDPTVKSMLVVLNCIHRTFTKKETDDKKFKEFADILRNVRSCPIRFNKVDLKNELGGNDAVKDLYIKMNARGLPLTNFEIFKSNLQKKNPGSDDERFDLLGKCLDGKDSLSERTRFIGEINTTYSDFLFRFFIDKEKNGSNSDLGNELNNDYDTAFYNLINETFRIKFLSLAIEKGVGQKDYRNDNKTIFLMTGREFSDFIETRGLEFTENYNRLLLNKNNNEGNNKIERDDVEKVFCEALNAVINLLKKFNKIQGSINIVDGEGCYKEDELLMGLKEDPNPKGSNIGLGFPKILARHAIFEFIRRFDLTEDCHKQNYHYWCEFVYRMVENSNLKSFEDICESITGFDKILNIYEKSESNKDSLVTIISKTETVDEKGKEFKISFNFDGSAEELYKVKIGSRLKDQFMEEQIKAKLYLYDNRWKELLNDAHKSFKNDGQLWFLLDMSFGDSEKDRMEPKNYSPDNFKNYLRAAETIFDASKLLKEYDPNEYLFERALFAYSVNERKKYHFLALNASHPNIYKLVGKDFSKLISYDAYKTVKDDGSNYANDRDRYETITSFIKELSGYNNIAQKINSYIDDFKGNLLWEQLFVKYPVLGKEISGTKYKSFEPDGFGKGYCSVYQVTDRRTDKRAEMCSLILAEKLNNQRIKYTTWEDDDYIDDGFPNRYFTIGNDKTEYAYMDGNFYSKSEDGTIDNIGNFDEAWSNLSNNQ